MVLASGIERGHVEVDSLIVELLMPSSRFHVCDVNRYLESDVRDKKVRGNEHELTDVEADQGGYELLNGKRVEAQSGSEYALTVVAPRLASHRKELRARRCEVSERSCRARGDCASKDLPLPAST